MPIRKKETCSMKQTSGTSDSLILRKTLIFKLNTSTSWMKLKPYLMNSQRLDLTMNKVNSSLEVSDKAYTLNLEDPSELVVIPTPIIITKEATSSTLKLLRRQRLAT